MVKKQSDLTQLKNSKKSTRFSDLERILKQHGWEHRSTNGSHNIYAKDASLPIMVVKPHGKHKYCNPMDVNKVIAMLQAEEEAEENEDD
jgi:predicted RNA binding protein YcfA (HicA-like mRNA interferase family)